MGEIVKLEGVMDEIVRQTGFDKEKIEKMFTYNDESLTLYVRANSDYTPSVDSYNGIANGGNGQGVSISIDLINGIKSCENSDRYQAYLFCVALVVLHETIHELDYRQNGKITTKGSKYNHKPIDVFVELFQLANINMTDNNGLEPESLKVGEIKISETETEDVYKMVNTKFVESLLKCYKVGNVPRGTYQAAQNMYNKKRLEQLK